MLPEAAMKWLGIPGCALIAFSLLLFFTLPALRCPACSRMSDSAPETFCPSCGDSHLQVSRLFGTHCDACGRTMGSYKYRNYPIRFCTHCGVLLAARGV
jgi:rRNA maturation endonuclease Nob1